MRVIATPKHSPRSSQGDPPKAVADNAGASIDALSRAAGISTRAVQMIVADLSRAGYIERIRVGRSNRYTVDGSLPLRHRAVRERGTVAALLTMLGAAGGA